MLPIVTTIPSIVATISKIAGIIGPAIAKAAPILLQVAGKYLPQIIKTVETISTVLNITTPNVCAESLGAKAMSADKKPEDFEQFNDYIDYLNKEVKIDNTTLSDDPVDKMARQAIGTSVMIKGINETLGSTLTLPFIKTVSQLGLSATVIIEIVKGYSNSGLSLDDCEKYISKTLPINQLDIHSETLVNAYQKSDMQLNQEDAEDMVMDLELPKISL